LDVSSSSSSRVDVVDARAADFIGECRAYDAMNRASNPGEGGDDGGDARGDGGGGASGA
jgi:hypothetical protein